MKKEKAGDIPMRFGPGMTMLLLAVGMTAVSLAQAQTDPYSHMSEDLRSSVKKVVVIAGQVAANEDVTGTYEDATDGLLGGIDSGGRIGTISKEIGGFPVNLPIPGLAIPGMIYGGLSGAAKREIQDFRDELTKQLSQAGNEPLTNNGLAQDVYSEIRSLPSLDSKMIAITTPIPEGTDAVLYVGFQGIGIDVQGKEAIITTSAAATLRRLSDGRDIYQAVVFYTDRDTLSNWTENEDALWQDYANFARHYLGRELSADLFDRIELEHQLLPTETDTADQHRKNKTLFVSKELDPTLAWELSVTDTEAYRAIADEIDESNIFYDLEIYDAHQLVYFEEQINEPRHKLLVELAPCQTYRWSVRPSYHIRDDIKYGEWMRFEVEEDDSTGKGIVGRQASDAPAYVQDFASLEIKCGRR
jgi:hypothetical protein